MPRLLVTFLLNCCHTNPLKTRLKKVPRVSIICVCVCVYEDVYMHATRSWIFFFNYCLQMIFTAQLTKFPRMYFICTSIFLIF
jgi:hypothetical protein